MPTTTSSELAPFISTLQTSRTLKSSHTYSLPEPSRGQVLAPEEPADDQPRYPLSFDELAEMIATGAHIPGIRQIPDKINEEAPSEPILAKNQVRKPWEGAPQPAQASQSLFTILGKDGEEGHQQ